VWQRIAGTPNLLIAPDRCSHSGAKHSENAVRTSSFWFSLILPVSDMLLKCELKVAKVTKRTNSSSQSSSD
jgi:hypothetical protein